MNYRIIFKSIVGSQAYGTSTPTSDVDVKFCYVQHPNEILGFNYQEQLNIDKDTTGYEVRRLLELLSTGNPNINEFLWIPQKCVLEQDLSFDILVSHREKFITKKCFDAYSNYAYQQIKKASNLTKKSRLEKGAIAKKELLDFVYFLENGKTIPIKEYLIRERLSEKYCGLVNLEHAKNLYAIYYDYFPDHKNKTIPKGYRGIADPESHMVKLSSVEKGQKPIGYVSVNHEGYSTYAKEYNEYQTWLKNRNINRFVEDSNHGQYLDGKNLLHCRRLLDMAKEIVTENKIIVNRPNAEYLLKIKRGEVNLEKLIEDAEADILELKELFAQSSMPDSVDPMFLNDLLLEIRNNIKW